MSKIYSYRRIGRSDAKLIVDSSAVTIIDNFWVQRPDTNRTWEEILKLKDIDTDLFCVALEGKENVAARMKKFEDITSILTIKGAFPKVVYKDKILKKDYNAQLEIAGMELGNALGISVAQARESGLYPGSVECDIFTNLSLSMAHVADFLTDEQKDDPRRGFYAYLVDNERPDLAGQFERILILSYLSSNFDMHQENFGIMYDSQTFDVVSMAPAYDFNDAFGNWGSPTIFHEWEMEHLGEWIKHHPDILGKADAARHIIANSKYLDESQKTGVIERLNYMQSINK